MRFEFATATRIVFGPGTVREVATLASELGRCALIVTGRGSHRASPLLSSLSSQKLHHVPFTVPGEPTTPLIRAGVERAREAGCDLVIGLGGGSAIDAGQALAALLTHQGEVVE